MRYAFITTLITLSITILLFTQISYADIYSSTILNATIDDSLINSRVQSELDMSDELSGESIRAFTNHGVVTLEGEVSDYEHINAAIEIAKEVNGVLGVNSDLTIKSSSP